MKALILKAPGTNRDRDAAEAIASAGAISDILPLADIREHPDRMLDYGMLVVPGGFSYGDALGAGRLFALDLEHFLAEQVQRFVETGRPVLGICNGFQVLVKAGLLPGSGAEQGSGLAHKSLRRVTLAHNQHGRFECRWVNLCAPPSRSIWTRGIEGFSCPVAHGEGRFSAASDEALNALVARGCVALQYADAQWSIAGGRYPENPNGSALDIAGICNEQGNVLGLMPHPENAVFAWQSASLPGRRPQGALTLFRNGIEYARH